jgi:hypothetical protein
MVTPRGWTSVVALPDGRALVIGGLDGSVVVGAIEAFDPVSGTFQVVAKGFPNTSVFTAALAANGEVLIAGTREGTDGQPTADTWLITP